MAAPLLRAIIRQIEKLSAAGHSYPERGITDRDLVDEFTARHTESAFAELVARHGPMVMRVCRRVLHHEQDAEDAFQACFLVLARSCGSIRNREAVADYLHGVAYRTAMKAKRAAVRRRNLEARTRDLASPRPARPTWDDVQAVLDEEIQRLPPSFRAAFVTCVLEGKTVASAAAELGCKRGTVSSRVMRARQRLQKQLLRRGVKLGALLAAVCVAEGASEGAVPARLTETTLRYGLLVAAGKTAAGVIPSQVAALATGVTRAMLFNKVRMASLVLLAVGVCFAGAGLLTHHVLHAKDQTTAAAGPNSDPDKLGQVRNPDPQVKPAEDLIEVTGRVLDPEGNAVAKARLYRESWLKDIPDGLADAEMLGLGTTDGEGRFRLKVPRPGASKLPYALIAVADGFGLAWTQLAKEDMVKDLTLQLVKDQKVRGRLVNSEGRPLVGVTVSINGLSEPLADFITGYQLGRRMPADGPEKGLHTPLNTVLRVTPTDKDGRFEISGLGVERVAQAEMSSDTAVVPIFFIAIRDGLDTKNLTNGPFSRGQGPVFGPTFEHAAMPCRLVEGAVVEAATGSPIAGATVSAQASRQTVRGVTDSKGRYKLVGMPKAETYQIAVTPGKDAPFLPHSQQVKDRPGLEAVQCNFELPRGTVVTGQVLDKVTGKGVSSSVWLVPLPENKAVAKMKDLNSYFRPAFTDSEGRFSLVTIPGPNLLLAQVSSQVMDGIPVNRYKVAELDEADRKFVKVNEKVEPGLRVIQLAGRPEILDHYHGVKVVDVKEGAGAMTCDLSVDPGNTVIVNLEDQDGKPLSGAVASGINSFNAVFQLKTAACTVFGLDPVRPRKVAFVHVNRKLAAVATVRGDENKALTVRLEPVAAVAGRLLDDDGKPITGVAVYPSYANDAANRLLGQGYLNPGRGGMLERTDKEGRFRLDGLVPGARMNFLLRKSQDTAIEVIEKDKGPLKPGETLDLGDLRVKPKPQ